MEKSFLREWKSFKEAGITSLTEEVNGKRLITLKGIFIQGEVTNQNGRIYPKDEIARAVNDMRKRIQERGGILGELDHPESLNISLERGSHLIEDIYMDGNNGIGKLKIIPTPLGKIAEVYVETGVPMGVSSRGAGDVDYRGMVKDFEISTVDLVATPSAPDAYPRQIKESLFSTVGYRGEMVKRLAEDASYEYIRNNRNGKAYNSLTKEILAIIEQEIWSKR